MFQLLYQPEYSNRIWGVIGPNDNPGVANFVAPISANSGLLTVNKLIITINSTLQILMGGINLVWIALASKITHICFSELNSCQVKSALLWLLINTMKTVIIVQQCNWKYVKGSGDFFVGIMSTLMWLEKQVQLR